MPGQELTADTIAIAASHLPWTELAPADTVRPSADLLAVSECFAMIESLVDAGRAAEAREVCARLIYGFQPFIAADAGLFATMLELLDRCSAHGLRRLLARATGQKDTMFPQP